MCRYRQLQDEGLEDDGDLVEEVGTVVRRHCCTVCLYASLVTFRALNTFTIHLCPQAATHDRAWDDWKDSVHKGSGNKMGKRF